MEVVNRKNRLTINQSNEEKMVGNILKDMYVLNYFINKNEKLLNQYGIEDGKDFRAKLNELLDKYPSGRKFLEEVNYAKNAYCYANGKIDLDFVRSSKIFSPVAPTNQTYSYILSSAMEKAQEYINYIESSDQADLREAKISPLDKPSILLKLNDSECSRLLSEVRNDLRSYELKGKDILSAVKNQPIKNGNAVIK